MNIIKKKLNKILQNFIKSVCWPFDKCTRPIFAFKGIELGVKLKSIQSLPGALSCTKQTWICVYPPPTSNPSKFIQFIQQILLVPSVHWKNSTSDALYIGKGRKSELIAVIPQIRADLSMHLVTFTLQASKLSIKLDSYFHYDMI